MDRSLQQEGRFYTLGTGDMSTTEAEKKRDEFMRTLNGSQEPDSDGTRQPLKLREFIEQSTCRSAGRSGKLLRLAHPKTGFGTTSSTISPIGP
jgi:hypothetical protein